MTERKKITYGGGRRQGKAEKLREETKAAIERGIQIYIPEAPAIAEDRAADE